MITEILRIPLKLQIRKIKWEGNSQIMNYQVIKECTVNPFSLGILWKIDIKEKTKNPTLKGYISKTRTNSESKLKFSESSFNLLQNSVIFCTLWPCGYNAGVSAPCKPRRRCQRLAALQELRNYTFASQNRPKFTFLRQPSKK